MKLFLKGHDFRYELENVIRLFFDKVEVLQGAPMEKDKKEDYCFLRRSKLKEKYKLVCVVFVRGGMSGKTAELDVADGEKECELRFARILYEVLMTVMDKYPPWGIMTGIRPAKFVEGFLKKGMSAQDVREMMCSRYLVSQQKAELCVKTALCGMKTESGSTKSYSLYVSIPFCPSRCSYCSFVSKSVERSGALIEPYLSALYEELRAVAKIARELSLKLETVYIGGGTPTVLSALQLGELTGVIAENFPIDDVREYSAEAGRPDTITKEKLAVLKNAKITRLSINPQTGNDEVLRRIGRRHTVKNIDDCFAQARSLGFSNINADLIAGLDGDSLLSFKESLEWLLSLSPENITVHALTQKRASQIRECGSWSGVDASAMVDYAGGRLTQAGYAPYYMYKQKATVDNLENTGFTKPGFEGLYNIFTMDERHTIIAAGAGAVSKLKNQISGDIERIYNYKYPAEYIDGFSTILKRKEEIRNFYENIVPKKETV